MYDATVSIIGFFTTLMLFLVICVAIAVAYRSTSAARFTAAIFAAALLLLPGILFLRTSTRRVVQQPQIAITQPVSTESSSFSQTVHNSPAPAIPPAPTRVAHVDSSGEMHEVTTVVSPPEAPQPTADRIDSTSVRNGSRYAWFASVIAVIATTSLITQYSDKRSRPTSS